MKVIGTFCRKENRVQVGFYDISPHVINALIATEDVRFYEHSGIDGWALARVFFVRGLMQRKGAGGGSTITQQLSKQLYSPMASNIFERAFQKPIEWAIAVRLEELYTKQEIITMYLNKFDFLNNAVGIKTASQVYFGKAPDQLKIEEAAMLVGMCKNPSLYNPLRRKEQTLQRRNVVLKQMEKADFITKEENDSLKMLPLTLTIESRSYRLAPYFREYLRMCLMAKSQNAHNADTTETARKIFDDRIWATIRCMDFAKNPKSDGSTYNLYTDGLKIYTTIDSRMQTR